jgi:hypothetical protein
MTATGWVAGQFSARVKFAPDGNSLTMSVVHFQIGGRDDIVLEVENLSLRIRFTIAITRCEGPDVAGGGTSGDSTANGP